MVFNLKKFDKKKGKKEVYDVDRDGRKLKVIIGLGENGEITQVMEKPNFEGASGSETVSGAHIFLANPEWNHVDYYTVGSKIGVEKTPERTFSYGENEEFWSAPKKRQEEDNQLKLPLKATNLTAKRKIKKSH